MTPHRGLPRAAALVRRFAERLLAEPFDLAAVVEAHDAAVGELAAAADAFAAAYGRMRRREPLRSEVVEGLREQKGRRKSRPLPAEVKREFDAWAASKARRSRRRNPLRAGSLEADSWHAWPFAALAAAAMERGEVGEALAQVVGKVRPRLLARLDAEAREATRTRRGTVEDALKFFAANPGATDVEVAAAVGVTTRALRKPGSRYRKARLMQKHAAAEAKRSSGREKSED